LYGGGGGAYGASVGAGGSGAAGAQGIIVLTYTPTGGATCRHTLAATGAGC
jgi:hypothetical protein